ncbi:MAG: serine hydrolase [Balneolaceae bacterium]|nr:serine hydrolase [Balneolaceae bacterium]
MKLSRLLVLSLTLFLFVSEQTVAQNSSFKEVQEYINHQINSGALTGIYVGYIHSDNALSELSLGKLGKDNDKKVNSNTIFEIGSISKTFTATLLAQMVRDTKFILDTPIEEFLPDSLNVPSYEGEKITLRHLATHTSDLSRLPSNFSPKDPLNPYADYSVQEIYEFLENYKLNKAPGSEFAYSNIGMGLLGHILELHYDASYEELVKDYIAKPLAMKSTGVSIGQSDRDRFARPYNYGAEASYWHFLTLAGAGGLRSTGNDMVKYIKAQMGLLNTSLQNAIETTHKVQFDTGDGLIDDIGLGWFYSTQHDTLMWHNGGTGGFTSFTGINKENNTGVVVLANGTSNISDEVGLYLLDRKHKLPEIKETISVSRELLKQYTGSYALSPMFSIEVTLKDGQLFAQATGQQKLPIFPESETIFFYKAVQAKLEFLKNEQGEINRIKLYQAGREIEGHRIEN